MEPRPDTLNPRHTAFAMSNAYEPETHWLGLLGLLGCADKLAGWLQLGSGGTQLLIKFN